MVLNSKDKVIKFLYLYFLYYIDMSSDNNLKYIYLYNNDINTIELVQNDNIIEKLYYLKYRLLEDNEIKKLTDVNIKNFFKKYPINEIKRIISETEINIPLFSIYHINIFLIKGEKVFLRVVYGKYRFPDKDVIKYIEDKKIEIMNKVDFNVDVIAKRYVKKIDLMLQFLVQMDLDALYDSYMSLFNKYSYYSNYIISCTKPSFIQGDHYKHLQPYYSKVELIKMAKNMNVNIGVNINIDIEKAPKEKYDLTKICKVVQDNDVSSKVLLEHQKYITDSGSLALIKYYTLQGSYLINNYLRKRSAFKVKNDVLETDVIRPVWEAVNNSPAFDKNYYVYRFVNDDSFLGELKIGEIFIDDGFVSTTRDPFYRSDLYQFGFILFKIKIPKGMNGIALSVELSSHFPDEQEIILPPQTKLKLIAKEANFQYYHIDVDYSTHIKTRYEFEIVDSGEIAFPNYTRVNNKVKINFLKIHNNEKNIQENVSYFTKNHLDEKKGFFTNIGGTELYIFAEFFNGTGAYKDFFAMRTDNGFGLYSILNKNVLFYIEIGSINGKNEMHVNYYLKYVNLNRTDIISENDFLIFIASIAYYFQIPHVLIHSDYTTCGKTYINGDSTENNKNKQQRDFSIEYDNKILISDRNLSGYYSIDIYNYLKNKKKRFRNADILVHDLNPKFNYENLDLLHKTKPIVILDKEDNDELYLIYIKTYIVEHPNDSLADFYVWVIENYCYFTEVLVNKMFRLYADKYENPFLNAYYILETYSFLYNKELIFSIEENLYEDYNIIENIPDAPKNDYRENLDKFIKLELLY